MAAALQDFGQAFHGNGRRCGDVPTLFRASRDRLIDARRAGCAVTTRIFMTSRIRSITFDCAEPYPLSLFWSQVTGFAELPDNPNHPDDPEAVIVDAERRTALLFIPVPEKKSGKNRVHLDIVPTDGTQAEEIERLLAIGATLIADHRRPDGGGWVVLADPEGNEFCVERGESERQPD